MRPQLTDAIAPKAVSRSSVEFSGRVWDVVCEDVDLGEAGVVTREFIRHTGAVGILALDDEGRVPLVYQYRHPVGMSMWELPAGLLDVSGEPPHLAAARELAEEADLRAGRWDVLMDWMMSPGGTSEAFRLFLARDLSPVPAGERHVRDGEELGMPTHWFHLDEVRDAVVGGELHSPSLVVGVLTACTVRESGFTGLRPADAPWPEHPAYR